MLVGENSTGKTTFLAMLSAVLHPRFPDSLMTSESPYDMSTFDSLIRRVQNGQGPLQFTLGLRSREDRARILLQAFYTNARGEPNLSRVELSTSGTSSPTLVALDLGTRNIEVAVGENPPEVFPASEAGKEFADVDLRQLFGAPFLDTLLFMVRRIEDRKGRMSAARKSALRAVEHLIAHFMQQRRYRRNLPVSIAPIRSRPKRTYDELSEADSPEGGHVPVLLRRSLKPDHSLANTSSKKGIGPSLGERLDVFGKRSALFSHIDVRKLGDSESDPFQVLVNTSGINANLKDVGYGVSQALPVLVQSLMAPEGSVVLLQQPEVHLHPRAQAELGTFLVELWRDRRIRAVVETHSDYLVDRVRTLVREEKVDPGAVQILFFEQDQGDSYIHPVQIDSVGNIVDAPPSYRSFFMMEERRSLGLDP
jgi:hypothetical protein